jgi:hypothetical protein
MVSSRPQKREQLYIIARFVARVDNRAAVLDDPYKTNDPLSELSEHPCFTGKLVPT